MTPSSFVDSLLFPRLRNDVIDVTFCNYGASIYALQTKDVHGVFSDVVLQYARLDDMERNPLYLNATVGPIAGRVQQATYSINGRSVAMQPNHLGTESLHSGDECLAHVVWQIEQYDHHVVFRYDKPPGPSQFPGHQQYRITYTLEDAALRIDYHATTTEDTVINLTNHTYFNLSGQLSRDVTSMDLYVAAGRRLTLNEKFSPIGVAAATGALDLRAFQSLSHHLTPSVLALPTQGLDHPYLVDVVNPHRPQAALYDPVSQRALWMTTTYPCVVVYTHNHADPHPLVHQPTHPRHYGVCLEAQFEPNGINVDGLHRAILRAGETYRQRTTFHFGLGKPGID